jgi:hypothetical protein
MAYLIYIYIYIYIIFRSLVDANEKKFQVLASRGSYYLLIFFSVSASTQVDATNRLLKLTLKTY